jgi:TonB family protein
VAADTTSAEGAFVLMAPGVGRYRVRIGDAYLGPPLALAAVDSMDQREYQVAAAPAAEPAAPGAELLGGAARVYDESEVEQKARLLPRSAPPVDMRGVADGAAPAPGRARWRAVVEAVVGPDGRAEPASVRAVSATTPEFGTAAERHVRGARFVPAQVAGAPVRQRVRVPVDVMSVTRVEVRRF